METFDITIDILKMEYEYAYSKLLYVDGQANKYVSYILTTVAALAAFLALLIKDGAVSDLISFSLLISVGALIIGLLIIMTLHHTVQCFRLGGYINYLEAEINRIVNLKLLRWESEVAPRYIHKNIATTLTYCIIGVAFLILLFAGTYVSAVYILPQWPAISVIIFSMVFLEFITAGVYIFNLLTVNKKILLDFVLKKSVCGQVEFSDIRIQ